MLPVRPCVPIPDAAFFLRYDAEHRIVYNTVILIHRSEKVKKNMAAAAKGRGAAETQRRARRKREDRSAEKRLKRPQKNNG